MMNRFAIPGKRVIKDGDIVSLDCGLIYRGLWADSGLTQAAGVPTLMFGPLGGNFHAPEEWVSIPEVASSARIVEGAVRRFLG